MPSVQPGVKTPRKTAYRGSDLELTDGGVQIESTLGARIRRDRPQRNRSERVLVSDRTQACTYGLTLGSKYASCVFVRVLQSTRGGRV